MIIPKSYMQFARKISVEQERSQMKDYHGMAMPDQNMILISPDVDREKKEHVFLHEFLHIALQMMGQDKLYTDEAFVNILAGLLHQMLTTQKGEIK